MSGSRLDECRRHKEARASARAHAQTVVRAWVDTILQVASNCANNYIISPRSFGRALVRMRACVAGVLGRTLCAVHLPVVRRFKQDLVLLPPLTHANQIPRFFSLSLQRRHIPTPLPDGKEHNQSVHVFEQVGRLRQQTARLWLRPIHQGLRYRRPRHEGAILLGTPHIDRCNEWGG